MERSTATTRSWQGVLGIKALTRQQWDILEGLVHAAASEELGTSTPTVDELALAARAVLQHFGEPGALRQHVRELSRREARMADEERVPVRWKGQLVGHLVDVTLEGRLGFANWSGRWVPLETSESKVGGPVTNAFLQELAARGRVSATVGVPGEARPVDFTIRWQGNPVGTFVGSQASTFIPGLERYKGTWESKGTPEARSFLDHLEESERKVGGGEVRVDPPEEYREMWFARGFAGGEARVLLRA